MKEPLKEPPKEFLKERLKTPLPAVTHLAGFGTAVTAAFLPQENFKPPPGQRLS